MTLSHSHDDLPLLLTLDELVNASAWDKAWVLALIDEAVIAPTYPAADSAADTKSSDTPYFSSVQLTQIRRASRLRRDFDASPQAIALILSLLDELQSLRQLQRQLRVTRVIQDVDFEDG